MTVRRGDQPQGVCWFMDAFADAVGESLVASVGTRVELEVCGPLPS